MTTETAPCPLGDIVADRYMLCWLLDFNTQDWIAARLSKEVVTRLDTGYTYRIADIGDCPTIPIEKPQAIEQRGLAE